MSSRRDDQVSHFSLTYVVTQCNAVKFVREGFGEKEVETVLERLDRLTHDEVRTTATQTLGVIQSRPEHEGSHGR